MNLFIDIIIALITMGFTYIYTCFYLNNKKINRLNLRLLQVNSKNKIVFIVISIVVTMCLITCIYLYSYNSDILEQIKAIIFCLVLVSVAAIDYRKNVIPNYLLLILLVSRVVIFALEFAISENALQSLINNIILSAIVVAFFVMLLLIFKNSIGMGDIKLFAVMCLYLNTINSISAIFLSLMTSFFISIVLMILKKKKRKDTISFGPSILIGTILAVCILGV